MNVPAVSLEKWTAGTKKRTAGTIVPAMAVKKGPASVPL